MSSIHGFKDRSLYDAPRSSFANPPSLRSPARSLIKYSHTVNPSKESIESSVIRLKSQKSCYYECKNSSSKNLDDSCNFSFNQSNLRCFSPGQDDNLITEKSEELLIDCQKNFEKLNFSNINPNIETLPIHLCKGSEKDHSIDEIHTTEKKNFYYLTQTEPSSPNFLSRQLTIRENLKESIKNSDNCEVIDFYQAFQTYSSIEISDLKKKRLWKKQLFSKLCSCFRRTSEMDYQTTEVCEKFVAFGYSEFNHFSVFHRNLLISAGLNIFDEGLVGDLDFVYKVLINRIRCRNRIILIVFMNVLFLKSFFAGVLEMFKERVSEDERMRVFYKLSKINVDLLRKKKMNSVLRKTQKTLEHIFFVFAGLCLYYVHIVNDKKSDPFKQLNKFAEGRPEDILSISRNFYIHHNE
jgi:hypothetical protein